MSAGFFRGTNHEQDSRFGDKQKKLKKQMKFPSEYDLSVNFKKVKLVVLRPWVTKRVTELLGLEDEVVTEMVINMLEEAQNATTKKKVDPRDWQINLTGFLHGNAKVFMVELWKLLHSACNNPMGIPTELLEAKKRELEESKKKTFGTKLQDRSGRRRFGDKAPPDVETSNGSGYGLVAGGSSSSSSSATPASGGTDKHKRKNSASRSRSRGRRSRSRSRRRRHAHRRRGRHSRSRSKSRSGSRSRSPRRRRKGRGFTERHRRRRSRSRDRDRRRRHRHRRRSRSRSRKRSRSRNRDQKRRRAPSKSPSKSRSPSAGKRSSGDEKDTNGVVTDKSAAADKKTEAGVKKESSGSPVGSADQKAALQRKLEEELRLSALRSVKKAVSP